MEFKDLNLTELDKNLTEEEREEWQAIYASYSGRSIISGDVAGVDLHEFEIIPEGKKKAVLTRVRCLIVIKYRVKIIIPETEVFADKQDSGYHILHSMCGANVDYVITHIDREEGFAIASRKLALEKIRRANARRRYTPGRIVDVKVISVGRGVCTVTYNGFDVVLPQRDISYGAVPDLRETLHPGEIKKAMIKEYNKDERILKLSIKETTPHPFDGIETRHPIGCTRIAKIVGKYKGGIFCRLYDGVTDVLCSYYPTQYDGDFKVGDSVEIVVNKYNTEKKLVYGRILRKMAHR
jgi:ribosomal protein S1